ncbi:MAG: phosphohistidine phosphatase SixA [Pseudanabaenaceae cyanobacterium bins.68]|nr:phosphohistidine phosphatase SixA [Pseudanabaenaceae cyanobacterium bins.68]
MAFNLYLIRHGLAAERSPTLSEDLRPLTPEGKTKTKQVAKRLQELGLPLQALHTSPLARATQTARIFGEIFQVEPETNPLLAPQPHPEQNFDPWLDQLQAWRQDQPQVHDLGLVGHEPELTTWAEMLLWGGSRDSLVLKKAGILGLALPEQGSPVGESFLFLLLPPKLIV